MPVATNSRPYVNSLGMRFVPAGTPGVYFSIWETRVSDFTVFVEAQGYVIPPGIYTFYLEKRMNGSRFTSWDFNKDADWKNPGFEVSGSHPVVGISIDDAKTFCTWLSNKERREGRLPLDASYRLPTDEEWSAAVGDFKYPWGDRWPPANDDGNFGDTSLTISLGGGGWTYLRELNDGEGRTAPVGSYRANAFGIFDLGGNVEEMCDSPYRASLNSPDVLARRSNAKNEYDQNGQPLSIVRGGDWSGWREESLRTNTRSQLWRGYRGDSIGFRVVLSVSPSR
jgi:formylglycine-generating enzyme required for sulfatase activity